MMAVDTSRITTYILRCSNGELYTGKTNCLNRRMIEHSEGREGSWFNSNRRREFNLILTFDGNIEKRIKTFGAKLLIQLIEKYKGCPLP